MRLRRLLQFLSVFLLVLAVQGVHSKHAAAADNNCAVSAITLCNYNINTSSPGNGNTTYDQPFLTWPGHTLNQTNSVKGGATISLQVGYNAYFPSQGWHVVTWANISTGGAPASGSISSISAPGGISSTSYCFDDVPDNSSPYFNDNWYKGLKDGGNGIYICDGETLPINTKSKPVNTLCDPDNGNCSEPAVGASALWYNNGDGGYNNQPRYTLNIVTAPVTSTHEFCMRLHVSLTGDNAPALGLWGTSYSDYQHIAQNDLPNDKGYIGYGGNDVCFQVNPAPATDIAPSFSLAADCHVVTFTNLTDPNDAGSGVHFFGVIYRVNADGTRGAVAGKIDGRGSGTFSWDYLDSTHPPPNEVPTEAYQQNTGWSIDVGVTNIQMNGTDGPGPFYPGTPGVDPSGFGWVQTVNVPTCYTAACQSITVNGALSGTTNGVVAGQPFTISATFKNTQPPSSTDYLPASLTEDDGTVHSLGATIYHDPPWTSPGGAIVTPYGSSVAAGDTFTVQNISLTAPSGFTVNNLTVYADYWGLFAIDSSACTIAIKTYEPFNLTPDPLANLLPTLEDPTSAQYKASVSNPSSGSNDVYAPTTVYFYKDINGVKTQLTPTYTGGTYGVGTTTYYMGSAGGWDTYSIPHPPPNEAGDQYCSYILMGYTSGYVGPGDQASGYSGPDDPTDVAQTSGSGPYQDCPTVVNEPFVHVYNSGVTTGSSFPAVGGSCPGGNLGGWNNNSGLNPEAFGAGSQLNTLAALGIVGFASGQNIPPALNSPSTSLTFANSRGAPSTSYDSPSQGGKFGNTAPCLVQPTGSSPSTPLAGSRVDIGTLASGSYSASGNLTISDSAALGDNTNIVITDNGGNVYIAGSILYNNDGSWTVGNVPSFGLSVNGGNIYVDPNATELDGIYSAQPAIGGSAGKIYTCSAGSTPYADGSSPATPFAPMDVSELYDNCYKQLTVYGTFQAQQVNLMRTLGSLRDEKPVGLAGNVASPCSNQRGVPLSSIEPTCAAEVFILSPELYMSNPDYEKPNNGALQYTLYTSLPPVL